MNRQMRRQNGNMPQMNPLQIINSVGGPREAVMMLVKQPQFKNNKLINDLVQRMNSGDEQGVLEASRNIFRENNQDFDEQYRMLNIK